MEFSVKWPRVATWIREQIAKFQRRHQPKATDRSMRQAAAAKKTIAGWDCPGCEQKTLQLLRLVAAPDGWEVEIRCKNCDFKAIINSRGHDISGISREE